MRISDWSSDVCSSDLHPVQVTAVLEKVETDMGTTGGILVRHDIPSRKGLVEDEHEVRDLQSQWVVDMGRGHPFPPAQDHVGRRKVRNLSGIAPPDAAGRFARFFGTPFDHDTGLMAP